MFCLHILLTASSVLAASSPGHCVDSCSFSNTSYTHSPLIELLHALRQQYTLVVIDGSVCTRQLSSNSSCLFLSHQMQLFLTAIRFLVKVTVTVTIEPAVMLLLSSSSRTADTQGEKHIRSKCFKLNLYLNQYFNQPLSLPSHFFQSECTDI